MNLDQRCSQPSISLTFERYAPCSFHHETVHGDFDTDDIALIARTLNAAADAALFPQQAVPLRKLADLLTDAMENR